MARATEQPSDKELVARALAGDERAFGNVVERYQGRLVNFLFRMVRNYESAHDLAQEVFIKVYKALDRYDPKYKFSTWIFRVAHNLAIDQMRKRRVAVVPLKRTDRSDDSEYELEVPDNSRSPYRELRNDERGLAILEAVDELPGDYRELIVMRHYAELSYDEIATIKAMPLGTVKNKLFRARQMLKEKLFDYLGD